MLFQLFLVNKITGMDSFVIKRQEYGSMERVSQENSARAVKPHPKPKVKGTGDAVADELKDALRFRDERVSIINAEPSSSLFVFWFVVSCYFPVITACLGPVANTISIACVVEKWRSVRNNSVVMNPHSNDTDALMNQVKTVFDPPGVFAVNIVSLILGFTSNIVLMLHFSKKLTYLKSQLINITGWTLAGGMLLVDVVVCSLVDMPNSYSKTIGFWFACISSGLYLVCTIILTTHFIGYKLQKYPPTFNLLPNERSIMAFTVLLSIWLIWGAGMFSALLHITYGNALYFCTVSLLTIGLGDILPKSVGAKIMALIFSLSGVVLMGLIVFMTRSIIQKSSGPIFFFHRVENGRTKAWKHYMDGDKISSEREAFDLMKRVRRTASRKQHWFSLSMTVAIFMGFWLLGALVFKFAENWSYFNSIYFCFLCLLTIGYGDYAPKTGAGRAFFVIWALGAVPLMGAILSTVGDLLFDISTSLDIKIGDSFNNKIRSIVFNGRQRALSFMVNTGEIFEASDTSEGGPEETSTSSQSSQIRGDSDETPEENHSGVTSPPASPQGSLSMLSKVSSAKGILPPEYVSSAGYESEGSGICNLRNLQELLKAVKKLHRICLADKDYKLSFSDWSYIHQLHLRNATDVNEYAMGPEFWISPDTPLRFPLNEPHFAFLTLFKNIEELVGNLVEDEELYKAIAKRKFLREHRKTL
ncbi:Tok1p [Saccharomyces cerevisiae x Saccharomyces kudriavzevii VIN7]|uniref:Tok1p n=1 Tax=Saccharomyces cerevisiae x Saccharomyces kudriavzevii (strain VIN7) TaxID=1095631 RepID=H0GWR6_SACCK|nr:Tok1p [Saccharomyces cerevisiae x Saccharomyces kudriavzevii VIN7]